MATTTTKVDVQITDNGTLQKITTGANKAADALGGVVSKSKAASKALADTDSGRMGYDQARASGGTGAAGRDFAKQSQGLGGLVRVYATFAANLFAVSAAYNALSRAQDTANLVKGLDQLGAASGRNLGTLAKDIVKATDSAVSLREAMTATAQASAAGMSNKDILRMAEGAKKASQALGVDMPDALSRISRGITKLEPELLDEIGIFVRVDKASQDYAKSIGKPVSALTDLEKRAAFANAALTQVEAKFGEINIDSNPYTQLLASIKNVATDGLNLVNKVLGPLVGMLAQSPMALAGVLAGIGAILLNQALPAISQYRSELRKASQESTEFAQARAAEANAYRRSSIEANTAAFKADLDALAENKLASLDAAQKALENSKKGKLDKKTKQLLIDPDLLDTTNPKLKEYISHLDAMANKTDKAGNPTKISEKYKNLSTSLQGFIAAQDEYIKQDAIIQAKINAPAAKGTREFELQQRADLLTKASKRSEIVSTAADTANLIGFSNAWKELKTNVNTLNLSPTEKFFTLLRGGTAAATAGIIAMGSKLMAVFGWIGAIVAIGGVFISWLKDNEKQSVAASEALGRLEEASDSLARTSERLSKLDPLEKMSANSLNAKANAIRELSQSTSTAIEKVSTEIASRDLSEKLVSGLAGWFNANSESELAEIIATSVTNALKLAETSPELADSKKSLLKLTEGKTGYALVSMLKNTKGLQGQIAASLADMEKTVSIFSATALAAKSSANDLVKARTELFNSFKVNDPLSNFGRSGVSASIKLAAALEQPIANMTTIREVAEDIAGSGLLPTSSVVDIQNITNKLEEAQREYLRLISLRDDYTSKANVPEFDNKQAIWAGTDAIARAGQPIDPNIKAQKEANLALAKQADNSASKFKLVLEQGAASLKEFTKQGIVLGTNYLEQKLSQSFAEAKLTINKAYAGLLSGTTGGISAQATLDKKAVDIQNIGIDTQLSLIQSQAEQTLAIQENTIALNEGSLERMRENIEKPGANTRSMRDAIDNLKSQNDKLKSDTKEAGQIIRDPKSTLGALNKLNLSPGVRESLSSFLEQRQGARGTQAKAGAQKESIDIIAKAQIAEKKALDIANERANKDTEANLAKESSLKTLKAYGAVSEEVFIRESASIDQEKARIAYAKERATLEADWDKKREVMEKNWGTSLFNDSKNATAEAYSRMEALDKSYEVSKKIAEESGKVSEFLAKQSDSLKVFTAEQTLQISKAQELFNIKQVGIDIQSEELEKANSMGIISQDIYNTRKAGILTQQASLEASKKLLEVEADYAKALRENQDKRARIGQAGPVGPEAYAEINRELLQINANRDAGISAINRATDATKRQTDELVKEKDIVKQLNVEATNFASDFADAMFDATQSGKYDFSQMVNSMISDLGRLIWKQSMLDLYKGSSIQSGISGFFGKLLGAPTATSTEVLPQLLGEGTYANGGAFNSGVEMFAKGGTFSNQIVNSPTLFKFAKGTGMMGEAGPEAIMPLKRDANGRLGVSGGSQGSTQVVVNNYSGQEVETKESVDSRGQRKIEVSIGNMVAGEIMRSGSMAQQSIKNTFGSKPQLIRR